MSSKIKSFDAAGPVRRLLRVAVTRSLVASLSARFLPEVDRLVSRLSGGRTTFSAWVTGLPIIEIATVGARTGELRTHRVMGIPVEDGFIVVAANFGQTRNPAWYFNIRAHRRAKVNGVAYVATELHGSDRDRGFELALRLNPGWRRFQDRADRKIPVIRLTAEG